MPKRLIDCYPSYMTGDGPLSDISSWAPWKDDNSIDPKSLDMLFIGNLYGYRSTSVLLDKMICMEPTTVLSDVQRGRISNILKTYFLTNWSKLWVLYGLTYNPIENYDRTENETIADTRETTKKEKYTDTEKRDTDFTTETTTETDKSTTTATETDKSVVTSTETDKTTESKVDTNISQTKASDIDITSELKKKSDITQETSQAFERLSETEKKGLGNSTGGPETIVTESGDADDNITTVHTTGADTNNVETTHQTGSADDNIETTTTTGTGENNKTTIKETADPTKNKVTVTETADPTKNVITITESADPTKNKVTVKQTGDGESNKKTIEHIANLSDNLVHDSDNVLRSLEVHGNIGTMTTQDMFSQELELRKAHFFTAVFKDISNVLTSSIWEGCSYAF